MTRRHRKLKRGSCCRTPAMLAATLAGLIGAASANGYPPPPGAYHIDPGLFVDLPPPAAESSEQAPPSSAHAISSRMLPLPRDGGEHKPNAYDAANLFGLRRTTPDRHDPQPHPGDAKVSAGFAPEPPAAPYPNQDGFSMDFRPATPAQAPAGGFYQSEPPYHQGYSHYAPAYPNYPQYRGPMLGYGPAPAGPGYPAYRGQNAPAHPQPAPAGGLRTTAPTQVYYPASVPTGQDDPHQPRVAEPVFYPRIEHIRQAPESGTFSPVGNDAMFRPAEPKR